MNSTRRGKKGKPRPISKEEFEAFVQSRGLLSLSGSRWSYWLTKSDYESLLRRLITINGKKLRSSRLLTGQRYFSVGGYDVVCGADSPPSVRPSKPSSAH